MYAVDRTNSDLQTNPIGTGPVKLGQYLPGDRLVLKRFEQYWRTGVDGVSLPYLEQLTVQTIPDPGTLEVNLESGANPWHHQYQPGRHHSAEKPS